MPIIAFAGPLGSFKTCSMTRFAIQSWMRGAKLYSNYRLYGIPYRPVSSIEQVAAMTDGLFLGDELWLWVDSRLSTSIKNRLVTRILLASRHVGVNICYTSQGMMQTDSRVRLNTDATVLPQKLGDDCVKLRTYAGTQQVGLTEYYDPRLVYPFYSTAEVVQEVQHSDGGIFPVYYRISENPSWMKYLADNGIWGRNARKVCESIEKELHPLVSAQIELPERIEPLPSTHKSIGKINGSMRETPPRTSGTPSSRPRPRSSSPRTSC